MPLLRQIGKQKPSSEPDTSFKREGFPEITKTSPAKDGAERIKKKGVSPIEETPLCLKAQLTFNDQGRDG